MVGNRDQLLHAKSLKRAPSDWVDESSSARPLPRGCFAHSKTPVTTQLQGALDSFKTKRFDSLSPQLGMACNCAEVIHLRRTNRPLPQINLATISFEDVSKRSSRIFVKLPLKPGSDPRG